MNNTQYEVDINEVLQLFRELSYKEQKKSYKAALRKSANIVVKEAKKSLKRKIGTAANHVGRYGSRLTKGIKYKVKRDGKEAKVHIMGDFRLKFFEMGTRPRFLKRTYSYRGKMTANYFFKDARLSKEREAQNALITNLRESIIRINNRRR